MNPHPGELQLLSIPKRLGEGVKPGKIVPWVMLYVPLMFRTDIISLNSPLIAPSSGGRLSVSGRLVFFFARSAAVCFRLGVLISFRNPILLYNLIKSILPVRAWSWVF